MKMKIRLFIIAFFVPFGLSILGATQSFKDGEYLKYRIHYGFVNAGYATLNLDEVTYNGKPHFFAKGKGWTVGAIKLFFKVEDNYQTYIDKSTQLPSKFIRKIDEGGHTKDYELLFDQSNAKATKYNKEDNNKKTVYNTAKNVQDMLSAFYYLRNYDTDSLKTGDFITINIFMDDENLSFKVKILGREEMKTKFGKVKCLKIRPYVLKGRVFKAEESVTMWVTDDENKIPVQIKAELAVGSLKADLDEYKNLVKPISFKK